MPLLPFLQSHFRPHTRLWLMLSSAVSIRKAITVPTNVIRPQLSLTFTFCENGGPYTGIWYPNVINIHQDYARNKTTPLWNSVLTEETIFIVLYKWLTQKHFILFSKQFHFIPAWLSPQTTSEHTIACMIFLPSPAIIFNLLTSMTI